jgi:hypothetical protein
VKPLVIPEVIGSDEAKIDSYDEMHRIATDLGYPSLLEALEHLDELRNTTRPAPEGNSAPVKIEGIDAAIDNMDAHQVSRVLISAMGQLHRVAGTHGWAIFAKNVYAYGRSAMATERALGMLMMAGLAHSGEKENASEDGGPAPDGGGTGRAEVGA